MSQTNQFIIAANAPLLLTESEMSDPGQVIDAFFRGVQLCDIRDLLDDAFSAAIIRPDGELGEFDRSTLHVLHKEVTRLAEAAYLYRQATKRA